MSVSSSIENKTLTYYNLLSRFCLKHENCDYLKTQIGSDFIYLFRRGHLGLGAKIMFEVIR